MLSHCISCSLYAERHVLRLLSISSHTQQAAAVARAFATDGDSEAAGDQVASHVSNGLSDGTDAVFDAAELSAPLRVHQVRPRELTSRGAPNTAYHQPAATWPYYNHFCDVLCSSLVTPGRVLQMTPPQHPLVMTSLWSTCGAQTPRALTGSATAWRVTTCRTCTWMQGCLTTART